MRIGQQWESAARDLWADVREVPPDNQEERQERVDEVLDLLPEEQRAPFLIAFYRIQVRALKRSLQRLEMELNTLRLLNRRPEIQSGAEEPFEADQMLLVRRATLDSLEV